MESSPLRIALLSSVERTPDGALRAFQRIGGRTVIAWQADLARELGCERVICLCGGSSPDLIELQREVEAAGLKFNMIRGPLHLVGLATADQDIVVFADGLVIDRALALELLGDRRGILALPADAGIAAGFERIDAEHAWGGVLVARANIVEQLADLPPDSDTVSLLLRLALQAGTRRMAVAKDRLDSGELLLALDQTELSRREKALLDLGGGRPHWLAAGQAGANWLARRLAPDWLARGPMIAGGLAGLLMVGAVAAATLERPFAAFCSMALGAFALTTGNAMRSIRLRLVGRDGNTRLAAIGEALFDAFAVAALTLPSLPFMLPKRLFLPLVLIGLLRLAARLGPAKVRAMWSDRSLLFALLAPAAWFGVQTQAIALLVLAALAYCLISERNSRITTD